MSDNDEQSRKDRIREWLDDEDTRLLYDTPRDWFRGILKAVWEMKRPNTDSGWYHRLVDSLAPHFPEMVERKEQYEGERPSYEMNHKEVRQLFEDIIDMMVDSLGTSEIAYDSGDELSPEVADLEDDGYEKVREWRIEVAKNPPEARFKWAADIYCGPYHFREIEHNTRRQTVLLATQVLGKYVLTEEQQPENLRAGFLVDMPEDHWDD